MSKTLLGLVALVAGVPAANVNAATVSFGYPILASPSAAAIAAGVPANSSISKFYVTTDADILSVHQVQVTLYGGQLYQVPPPFGSDTEAPDPAFLALNRALEADSWITTPGATSRLGGGSGFPGDGTATWGDLTNDGPQTNFQFAQFTVVPGFGCGMFTARISVAGSVGPEILTFETYFPSLCPEPPSCALLALAAAAGSRIPRVRRRSRALGAIRARRYSEKDAPCLRRY
jgi:hypothetical protein